MICTVGEMDNEVVKAAVNLTGKAGTIVITGVGYYDMVLPGGILIGYHRRMQGSLFGGANPLYDIPMILGLWPAGDVKLTELVSQAVHAGPDQRGLPGHDGRQEPPPRPHPPVLGRNPAGMPYPILDPDRHHRDASPGPPGPPPPGPAQRHRRPARRHQAERRPVPGQVGRLLVAEHGASGTMARTKVNFTAPAPDDLVEEMTTGCDVIITGIGDCGSCSASAVADGIAFEAAGLPAAAICSDAFRVTADAMAELRGAPGYRYATTPHPVAVLTPDQVKLRAAQVLDDVMNLLTEPE